MQSMEQGDVAGIYVHTNVPLRHSVTAQFPVVGDEKTFAVRHAFEQHITVPGDMHLQEDTK